MTDSSYKARKAIYDKLKADTTLTGLIGNRIYAGIARQGTEYPYAIIGERSTDQRFKTKDAVIQSHKLRIYAYSRKDSPIEIENIKAAMFNTLEKQTLTVSGNSFVDCSHDGLDDVAIMEDGRTYRAILDFLITIQ